MLNEKSLLNRFEIIFNIVDDSHLFLSFYTFHMSEGKNR